MYYKVSETWVILDPIEKSIKEKIENIGTPLSEWNIQINYGIKTGFNDAFIISGEIKDKLVYRDPKSAEIIRPILRGRDIKRYGYNFHNLFIIATFPSRSIDIDNYPEVKKHLLSFGKERLEQTGSETIVNGIKVKSRKSTNNKWFETQDSIAYWEEFNNQKLVWNRIGAIKNFSLVDKGIYIVDSMHFMTGNHLYHICGFLNSRLINWLMTKIVGSSVGGNAGNADNVRNLPIFFQSKNDELDMLVKDRINIVNNEQKQKAIEQKIDDLIYGYYQLNDQEISFLSDFHLEI